jgi:hypothetical protein
MHFTEQGNGDAVKAEAHIKAWLVAPDHTQGLNCPAHSRQQAAQHHGENDRAGYLHPGIASGVGVQPHRADLEAQGGVPEQPPDGYRRGQGDKEPNGNAANR